MNIHIKGYRRRSIQEEIEQLLYDTQIYNAISYAVSTVSAGGCRLNVNSSDFANFKRDIFAIDKNKSDEVILKTYLSVTFMRKMSYQLNPELYRESQKILMELFAQNTIMWNNNLLKQNPYFSNIKIPLVQSGNWALCYNKYLPMEILVNNCMYNDGTMHIGEYGIATEELPFPALGNIRTNQIWMSISPNEMTTMKNNIEHASGKVITFGLGLGYFTYMVHLKDDVGSVTVIERDKDVIQLFKEHILPQFEHKEKIHIIHSDAYEYLDSIVGNEYDYCFVDIWTDAEDALEHHYLKLRNYESKMDMKFEYWIEECILSDIGHMIANYILKSINFPNIYFAYKVLPYYKKIEEKIGDITINTPDELRAITTINSVKKLLS